MNRILRHIELVRDKVQNWEAYPFAIPAVAKLERLEFDPRVTFFVGDNGSGKSTLVEAIAIKAGFLWVAIHRFRDRGLFILDEPEAALSPQRQLALMGRMHQLIRAGSQFIVSTHSPILMAYPGARIYLLDRGGIERVSYTDTEHYAVTKTFLQDPERMLQRVFADVDAGDVE